MHLAVWPHATLLQNMNIGDAKMENPTSVSRTHIRALESGLEFSAFKHLGVEADNWNQQFYMQLFSFQVASLSTQQRNPRFFKHPFLTRRSRRDVRKLHELRKNWKWPIAFLRYFKGWDSRILAGSWSISSSFLKEWNSTLLRPNLFCWDVNLLFFSLLTYHLFVSSNGCC